MSHKGTPSVFLVFGDACLPTSAALKLQICDAQAIEAICPLKSMFGLIGFAQSYASELAPNVQVVGESLSEDHLACLQIEFGGIGLGSFRWIPEFSLESHSMKIDDVLIVFKPKQGIKNPWAQSIFQSFAIEVYTFVANNGESSDAKGYEAFVGYLSYLQKFVLAANAGTLLILIAPEDETAESVLEQRMRNAHLN